MGDKKANKYGYEKGFESIKEGKVTDRDGELK